MLVTGATGFIGSAVVRAARRRPGLEVRTLARTGSGAVPSHRHVVGDVTDAETVREAVRGIDVVVHCAHGRPTDPDPARASSVGTRRLCEACHDEGAQVVLASTTGVYGPGPHHWLAEGEARRLPPSTVLRARADAEDVVLEHGGVVVRPPLVLGRGDRWLVPSALAAQVALGWIDGGHALQSVVHVDELSKALLDLGTRAPAAAAYHYCDSAPISMHRLLRSVAERVGVRLSDQDLPRAHALRLLGPAITELLAADHVYDSTLAQDQVGPPSRGATQLTDDDVDWYRTRLRGPAAAARLPGLARPPRLEADPVVTWRPWHPD